MILFSVFRITVASCITLSQFNRFNQSIYYLVLCMLMCIMMFDSMTLFGASNLTTDSIILYAEDWSVADSIVLVLLKWLVPFDWMTLCSFHLNLSYEFGFLETIAAEYNDVGSLRKEIG